MSCAPKISMILPNYNHGKYLRQSIDSVLSQTYRDFELIIVDDGSTDDSWNIIQDYAAKDNRVIAEKFPANRGVEAAIGRCMELCSGEYLFGRASDDYLINNDFFRQAMNALAEYPEAAGAFAGCEVVRANTGERYAVMGYRKDAAETGYPYTYLSKQRAQKEFLFDGFFVPGASAIWKRTLLQQAGGYDRNLGPQSDYFLNHVLPMLHGVVEIHTLVTAVRGDDESYSAKANDDAYFERHALVEKKIRSLVKGPMPDAGWNNWRSGIIKSRIPDPEMVKPQLMGQRRSFLQRVIGFARRKILALIRGLPAPNDSPWSQVQRRRNAANAIFEKIVWGRDIL